MSKPNLSLATILSTVAIASGVLLATANPSPACPLSELKNFTPIKPENSPNLTSDKSKPNQMWFSGGMAAITGLFAAGIIYGVRRRSRQTDVVADEVSIEHPEASFVADDEVLVFSNPQQVTSNSTADKEVALTR